MMMEEKACFWEKNGNTAVSYGSLKRAISQVHSCPQVDTAHFGQATLTHTGTAPWFKIAKHSMPSVLFSDV